MTHIIYVLIVVMLVMNLLIAVFSNTMARVTEYKAVIKLYFNLLWNFHNLSTGSYYICMSNRCNLLLWFIMKTIHISSCILFMV